MSGSVGGPTFRDLRQQIESTSTRGGQHVRGTGEDGGNQVYLHKGFSGFGQDAKIERQNKQEQGAKNVFEALKNSVGESEAKLLFTMVGRDRGRDLMKEFKVSDFDRILQTKAQLDYHRDNPSPPSRKEPDDQEALILRENPYTTRWDDEEGKIIYR